MRASLLGEKLWIEAREFVTAEELKGYCKAMKLDYEATVHYLSKRKRLVRIFRGIFYVRSPEEIALGRGRHNHLELVAKGLELKGVRNWYFGLHTALKLNNMTHEHFAVEEVVSDSLFRANPVGIAGHKFRFVKLSPTLLGFGIRKEGLLRFSDPEKTVLDFIYLSRHDGLPDDRIVAMVSGWTENADRKRILAYAKKYPKTVAATAGKVIG